MKYPTRLGLVKPSAGLSLLLCATVLILWGRGYWAMDGLKWRCPTHEVLVVNSRGAIRLRVIVPHEPMLNWSRGWKREMTSPVELVQESQQALVGFSYVPYVDALWEVHRLTVATWAVAGVTAILPLHSMRLAYLARWRRRHEFCVACGYDLRGTTQRCPECGTAVAAI